MGTTVSYKPAATICGFTDHEYDPCGGGNRQYCERHRRSVEAGAFTDDADEDWAEHLPGILQNSKHSEERTGSARWR